MPRDGSGNFTLPANTQAVSGDPISSTKFNTLVQDLEADANTDRPIVAGGTGASTALAARANLGLEIGVNVQAYDAGLLSIAGLTTLADRSIYTTASDTYAVYTLTAAGRAILDDADASAQRTTLGLGSLATLSTINNDNWSGTDLAVANGGTGASDASTALTNLGALAASAYTASDVLSKLLTVDGAGSGLDADLIDGVQPSAFALTILDDADAAAVRTTIGAGDMLKSENLSGLANYTTARSNMGLANGATTTISAFALTMLDDVDAAAVRTTIGVGLGTGDLVAANNLSDVANASTSRTNLGLAIGTNVQAYDAGLQSIAGLTTEADRGIYTTASDTYAVYTLTAAGRAILDDADASAQRTTLGLAIGTNVQAFDQQLQDIAALAVTDGGFIVGNGSTFVLETDATARTSLGLGTAATVNTGTSGATIPLLDGSNTFSAAQFVNTAGTAASFSLQRTDDGATGALFDLNHISASPAANDVPATLRVLGRDSGNNTTVYGRLRWIVSDPTDTSEDSYWTISSLVAGSETSELDSLSGTLRFNANTVWHAGNDGAGSGLDADTLDGVQGSAYAPLASPALTGTPTIDGAAAVSVSATQTLTNKTLTTPTINGGTIQSRLQAASETTGTLTVASANKTIQATGDITIPNAVFAAGDIILIYAGASSRTITEGSSVTMRLGGTATTGSRTLAARGVAVLFFVSSSEVVVSGGAVT